MTDFFNQTDHNAAIVFVALAGLGIVEPRIPWAILFIFGILELVSK